MTIQKLMQNRYSVRSYSQMPLQPEHLAQILNAGRAAPTAANRQPQRVLVVRSEDGLERLGQCSRSLFGAPCALIVCTDREAAWQRQQDQFNSATMDASIVTTHMMLQAWDLGIGSCWVCAFDPDKVRRLFNIPDNWQIECLLPLGYPAADAAPGPNHSQRKPPEATVFDEQVPEQT
ncbi:MAG: nitroreductase family protein [Eubacteriales bacterium]|nr:nitroreductase family protein [Eubacteriales bacterium]